MLRSMKHALDSLSLSYNNKSHDRQSYTDR